MNGGVRVTHLDGFRFESLHQGQEHGSGILWGPDGSRAGIQWEVAESPYIMRIEDPAGGSWGIYRLGFTRPVASEDEVTENLRELLPKLKVLYSRIRGAVH
jgi:hypothetical protein